MGQGRFQNEAREFLHARGLAGVSPFVVVMHVWVAGLVNYPASLSDFQFYGRQDVSDVPKYNDGVGETGKNQIEYAE